jgi:hypothetical protein
MRTCSQVTAHVAVFRGATYDVVADWEFSPACGRAAWRDDARRPVPRNVAKQLLRRSRICEVGIADHGREFSFRTPRRSPTRPCGGTASTRQNARQRRESAHGTGDMWLAAVDQGFYGFSAATSHGEELGSRSTARGPQDERPGSDLPRHRWLMLTSIGRFRTC